MNDTTTQDELQREARTFIVLAVAAGFTAWDIGFDLGAFDNIDHRRIWAIWILCTIALTTSLLFKGTEFERIGHWRLVLAVPSLWLLSDFLYTSQDQIVTTTLTVISVATLPLAGYVLIGLLAGDFLTLTRRSQASLVAITATIFLVGLYVGTGHDRFLTCDDFARAGDYIPTDCATTDP